MVIEVKHTISKLIDYEHLVDTIDSDHDNHSHGHLYIEERDKPFR